MAKADIILGAQNRTSAELRNVARDLRTAASEATRAERAFTGVERGIDRLRDSEIRAAKASGDQARALQLLDSELGRAQQGTVRYNDLLARQATVSKQAEGGTRSFGSALNVLQQGLGALGIGLGIQQLIQFGTEAFTSSQQLKSTQNSIRLLTGDTRASSQVFELARRNQELYGGTLKDNTEQLIGFAVAAKRSGVSVQALNDLSKRLAILSPEQGAAGASIAINEALSGNASSLVRRFEIPKQLLKGIEDASLSAAQKLAILDSALTKSGVSAEVVAGSVTDAQKAVNRAAAEFEQLKIAAGEAAAPAVEVLATGLTRLFGVISSNPQAIAELRALFSGKTSVAPEDVQRATQDVARASVQKGLIGGSRGGASASTFGFRQGEGPTRAATDFTPERLAQITEALTQAKAAGGEYSASVDRLIVLYRDGSISAAQLTIAVDQLSRASQGGGSAFDAYRSAVTSTLTLEDARTKTLVDQIDATQKARDANQDLANVQALIASGAGDVINGLATQGQVLDRLARQTGIAGDELARLLNLQIAVAAQAGAAQGLADQRAGERSGGKVGTQGEANANAAAARIQADRQRALAASQRDYAVATGSSADRLAILRRELAGIRQDTPDYYKKLTEVKQAEQAVAAERERAGKKGDTAYRKEVKSAEDVRKARFDLLSDEQKLADLRTRVASGRLSELDRLEATKQIKDLEQKITDEREKQTKSAIDARLAALDDRKQRRIEERELAAARRILASGETSGDQKAAAQDVLARVELERQKRQLEIAGKVRDAGGVAVGVGGAVALPGAVAPLPGARGAAGGGLSVGVPIAAAGGADITQQLLAALSQIQFTAYIDGRPVAASIMATLRQGLAGAKAGGIGQGA